MNLPRYTRNRLLALIPLLLVVSVITFGLSNLSPGDPARLMLLAQGQEATAEAVTLLRKRLGLDSPIHLRYLRRAGQMLRGDLDLSYTSGQPVLAELLHRLPATACLAFTSLGLAALITLPVGLWSARFPNSPIDMAGRLFASVGSAMPSFWVGLLLLQWFGVELRWLPVVGDGDGRHLILPSVTLALLLSSTYVRLLRASVLEVLRQEFVWVLRAKGVSESAILLKHALRNAMPSILTAFGLSLTQLLGGSVVVESLFAWPGMGSYAVSAVFQRDYPVIQGYALFMTVVVLLLNLAVDLSYRLADPRIRLGGETDAR